MSSRRSNLQSLKIFNIKLGFFKKIFCCSEYREYIEAIIESQKINKNVHEHHLKHHRNIRLHKDDDKKEK